MEFIDEGILMLYVARRKEEGERERERERGGGRMEENRGTGGKIL